MNNDNLYKETNSNLNISNDNNDYSDLDKYPGIYSETSEDKTKSNIEINQDNNYEFLMENDIIPYSPEMSEEPINPNERKKLITDSIVNNNNNYKNNNELNTENIFTFKNIIRKSNSNFNENNNNESLEDNNNDIKIDNLEKNQNPIKANILNFDDIIKKRNNDIINKSKNVINKSKNKNNSNIDNNKTLSQKKNLKYFNNKKNNNNNIKNNDLKKTNKNQKKSNNKKQILTQSSIEAIEFENFMKDRIINNKNKSKDKNIYEPLIKKEFGNDFEKGKNIYKKEKEKSLKKLKENKIYQKSSNKSKNINKNENIQKNAKKSLNYKKIKNNIKSGISPKIKNDNNNNNLGESPLDIRDHSADFQNISKNEIKIKKVKSNNFKSLNKKEDANPSMDASSEEIKSPIINKKYNPVIQRRKKNHSKFDKFDIGQISYELNKEYSSIRQDKENDFLERMQFDSLKRNNKNKILNKLIEKNKVKLNEPQREKAFNRLMNDANRRLFEKKQKQTIDDIHNIIKNKDIDNDKKYNEEEWNEIYQKRFKNYEDNKKKKIEVNMQKKKIQKMIEEEEEINMCKVKKLPENKIKQSAQRLFDDAKKRIIIKNRQMKYNKNKDNIHSTKFNDVEDISKYMKSYKSEIYNFNFNNNENNSNFNKKKNIFNDDYVHIPKSLNKNKKLKKYNFTYADNDNFSVRNNIRKNRIKNQINYFSYNDEANKINNITFDNKFKFNFNLNKNSDFEENNQNIPINEYEKESPKNYLDEYDNSNLNNSNINNMDNMDEENENENDNNKQENIVDNFLYDYCINKYYD